MNLSNCVNKQDGSFFNPKARRVSRKLKKEILSKKLPLKIIEVLKSWKSEKFVSGLRSLILLYEQNCFGKEYDHDLLEIT